MDTSATLSHRSRGGPPASDGPPPESVPRRVLRRGPGLRGGPGKRAADRLDPVAGGGHDHADEFPLGLLRPYLREVAGAEGEAHQEVPDAFGSVQGVTLARSLPVELQLAVDLAARLLAGDLGEVRHAEVEAAEEVPEDLRPAKAVLLPAGLAVRARRLVARRLVALL